MTTTLNAPYCRYDIEHVTVTQLLVAEGAAFAPDTPLYEVEADKTITEVTASAPGTLLKWLVATGDRVAVGQPVAEVGNDRAAEPTVAPVSNEILGPTTQGQPPRAPCDCHATLSVEVRWDSVQRALRSAPGDSSRDRPTTTIILAECLRQALRTRNALWRVQAGDGRLLTVPSLALGIAIAHEDDALTTAVVENALEHSTRDFARRVQSAIAVARSGEARSLRNVPVVISDLSQYGIRHGVPAVVAPSVATLLLGEAYPQNDPGSVAPRRCASLALSFDHRCLNGAGAASLLADLKRRLETFDFAPEERSVDDPGAAAPGQPHEVLGSMLCELLAVATVAPDATLWSLGGDSLLAAELAARMSARFGVEILVHDIYEHPTLLKMGALILQRGRQRIHVAGGGPDPRVGLNAAPLTYRQEARWRDLQRLGLARNSRATARAFRLRGPVDATRLADAFDELVRRHEALRTRIISVDGSPLQRVDPAVSGRLEIIDLRDLPETRRDADARHLVDELVNEPVDMAAGPLFGARLLQLDRNDHILAIAADHMVADRASAGLILHDVHALYSDAASGSPSLPGITIQLGDFAMRQRAAQDGWIEQHGAYWHGRLGGAPALRLPHEESAAGVGWGSAPIHIDDALRKAMCGFSREEGSTPALTVLTAYVALVLRWCDAQSIIVAVMTDGRDRPEIRRTVGFFASDLYLRLQLGATDSLRDLHRQVMEEYVGALRHQDFGLLPALMPDARLPASPSFNWYQTDMTPLIRSRFGGVAELHPFPFRVEMKELEADDELSILGGQPWVALTDEQDRIAGCVLYRRNQFTGGTMAELAQNLAGFAAKLGQNPNGPVSSLMPEL